MSKHEQKHCPRCNRIFECKRGSIMQCQCNSIQLSDAVAAFIEKEYNDCLCISCLHQIKKVLQKEKS